MDIVEGTVLAKIVVKLVFWLGLSDLIVLRLIVGNLICLELLTDLDVGLMALTSTLKF